MSYLNTTLKFYLCRLIRPNKSYIIKIFGGIILFPLLPFAEIHAQSCSNFVSPSAERIFPHCIDYHIGDIDFARRDQVPWERYSAQNNGRVFSLGRQNEPVWLRIPVQREQNDPRNMRLWLYRGMYPDVLEFYDERFDDKPLACRGRKTSEGSCRNEFLILPSRNEEIILYLKLDSSLPHDYLLDIRSNDYRSWEEYLQRFLHTHLAGMGLIVLLLSLYWIPLFPRHQYLYFLGFLFSAYLASLNYAGWGIGHSWLKDWFLLNETRFVLNNAGILFVMLFVRSFLGGRNLLGNLDYVLQVCMVILFVSVIVDLWMDNIFVFFVVNIPVLLTILFFLVFMSIRSFQYRIQSFRFLAVLWGIKWLVTAMFYLYYFNIVGFNRFLLFEYYVFLIPEFVFGIHAMKDRKDALARMGLSQQMTMDRESKTLFFLENSLWPYRRKNKEPTDIEHLAAESSESNPYFPDRFFEKESYGKSNLSKLDPGPLVEGLSRLMNEEKIYKDWELKSSDLASQLGISSHQLSELLNTVMGTNYFDFVSRYRVEEAKRLLSREPEWDAIRIGLESGFSSKATFYRAFKEGTGMTPQAYRKQRSEKK